jgi:RNA ligase (TIGR02306 family)
MSRKLATFRIVNDVSPIEGADQIEVVTVDSWKVVVRKNEVTVGSTVIYFEIDSWIPTTLAPFLTRNGVPKKFNEVEGEKLRTIKLRGQISQGLIMNIADVIKVIPDFEAKVKEIDGIENGEYIEGTVVTDILGIMKWELPSCMGSFRTKGNFPSFIPKTDQERVQNLTKKFADIKTVSWEVTEKYDGSSLTVYYSKHGDDVKEGVCSRNLDLQMEAEEGVINTYWEIAIREKLLDKLREANALTGLNLALQGEMVGIKIGPNIYKLTSRDFWLFDIYDIDAGRYYTPTERQAFAKKYDIKHVPVLFNDYTFPGDMSIADLLKFAEGKSVLNPKTEREGLVFKRVDPNHGACIVDSFKAISNNYLMKIGD